MALLPCWQLQRFDVRAMYKTFLPIWAEHSQGIAGLYFGAIMLFFAPTLFQMEDTHEQKVSAYSVDQ